jgi:hypothetical protein
MGNLPVHVNGLVVVARCCSAAVRYQQYCAGLASLAVARGLASLAVAQRMSSV